MSVPKGRGLGSLLANTMAMLQKLYAKQDAAWSNCTGTNRRYSFPPAASAPSDGCTAPAAFGIFLAGRGGEAVQATLLRSTAEGDPPRCRTLMFSTASRTWSELYR